MMTSPRPARHGFTLLELVCVMMALIILGAVLVPTLSGIKGDTHAKAGADVLHSYIAMARSQAQKDGVAYRLALSADGRRVRIAPDTYESLGEVPTITDEDEATNGPCIREDDLPPGVMAAIVQSDDDTYIAQDQSGWKRVATFLCDGTCREVGVEISVTEQGVAPVVIRIRGITGSSSTTRGGTTP